MKKTENKASLLEKELNKAQVQIEKEEYSAPIVEEVQKLLTYEAAEDRLILKNLGMDAHIVEVENMKSRRFELEKFKNTYKGKIFSKEAIKELAVNYRLRFLKTSYYKGKIDVEIPAKIKEFRKDSEIEITNAHLSEKFYILAPSYAFNLEGIKIPEKDPDPILFYKIDDNNFRMIHKWGSDFSIMRAIIGWKWKSQLNFVLFGMILSFLAASIITPLFFSSANYWDPLYCLVLLGITALGTLLHTLSNTNQGDFITNNLTPNCWENNTYYH